ncbi:acyl-CoA reductase-like NAD-dependent aldehyde dehydrogenase [Leucobacter exalbidus]|uniref:aldehyde dehydrogenase (NAD(+)) n=1 Tax=Leucobacter exalbidus TaxID=662960 RepID=A0A940T1K1_9MICO|nr:aldehyde dehydrogenase family protein [Leucobacter exalbidus]MBP1326940.1 acyl-CoA reductase-like NAD-dependent aldehyde dehydrogenase [Leucobacter exalbidus]
MTTEAVHYISGNWVESADREWTDVVNPATGETVGRSMRGTPGDVDRAVLAARQALPAWSAVPMADRIDVVERLAEGIAAARSRLADALVLEVGVPVSFGRAAQVGVALGDLAALVAAARDHVERTAVSNSLVVSVPVGVVAAITPWNFPLHQIVLKVGAALLAGCTVVLKPSEVSPLNAAILAEIINDLRLPAGVVNVVFGDGTGVGEPLSAHTDVDLVSFTGSRMVGERIMANAARNITKVSLELGGKSAAIILDDAPIEESAAQVLGSCFANTGQTCAALTRVLVPRELAPAWEEAALVAAAHWVPGDPAQESTVMGPAASALQADRIRGHVRAAIADGARLVVGGPASPDDLVGDAWVQPTIFADVTPQMRIFREEVFGPVLAISVYDTAEEAIALANDSDYGLAGGVWSANPQRALDVALRIQTGTIGINGAGLDVGAPFGGVKQSGIGRECGVHGFEEFLETKSIMGATALLGPTRP